MKRAPGPEIPRGAVRIAVPPGAARGAGRALSLLIAAGLGGASAMAACAEDRGKPPLPSFAPAEDGGGGGLLATSASGPPPVDAGGLCGNELHEVISNAPNLYFVFDASGSMAEAASATKKGTRYDAMRAAAVGLLRKLGPLVNVGAALFPGASDSCAEGREVLPVTPGDPKTGEEGPTTHAFRVKTLVPPSGGTPTASTLRALRPRVVALPGETFVLLVTDGGPNCNPDAACGADDCMPNLEGQCEPSVNCCDPAVVTGGPLLCVDRQATVDAIAGYASEGVPVYVLGIPGSEAYADVLGDMALAGGAARPTPPYHYGVADFDALEAAFAEIAEVLVSCEFSLADPPEDQSMTNVYVDGAVLPSGPEGWGWKDASTVELVGAACSRLKKGEIGSVQIVSGCPTEVPK